MICSSRWASHLITFMAGSLGVVELASITVVLSFRVFLFTFAQGIEEGTSAIIGNCIGANNVPLAKRFYWLIGVFTICMIAPLSLTTFFARDFIASYITNEEEVRDSVSNIFILVAIVFVFDAGQTFFCGPILAMGLQ